MKINVTARGTKVKESFHELLEAKLSKFNRFFDNDIVAEVVVSVEDIRETVEVTIRANNMVYRSEKTTADRRNSLDSVVDSLFRQIVKNKTKLQKQMKSAAFESDDIGYFGEESTDDEFKIVRTKHFSLKPMYAEEAVLQMNLIGHSFYVFRDAETDETNVVYLRDDGNYGLIESD